MNWLDMAILVIIAVPTFISLKAGVIKAVLSLAGLIVGILLAGRYYATLAEQLTFISQNSLANIAAFAIILIGIMIITGVVASLLKWIVSAIMLGWVNRIGGAVFGFLLGALFCSALLAIWAKFLGTATLEDSALAILLLDRFPMILALLPGEFDSLRSFFR